VVDEQAADWTAIGTADHGNPLVVDEQAVDWDGTAWILSSPVQPAAHGNDLTGVSCVAPVTC